MLLHKQEVLVPTSVVQKISLKYIGKKHVTRHKISFSPGYLGDFPPDKKRLSIRYLCVLMPKNNSTTHIESVPIYCYYIVYTTKNTKYL